MLRWLLTLVLLTLTAAVPVHAASGNIVIGGFDSARGGARSLDNLTNLSAALLADFPGSSISTATTLTPSYLATLNVVLLASGTSNTSCITPLSPDEQAALLAFSQSGGTVIIFTDNDTFCSGASTANNSLVSPFGLHATGTLSDSQNITFLRSNPISSGPFGSFGKASTLFPGWYDNVGAAIELASLDANGQPSVVILPAGSQNASSGNAVFFSDNDTFLRDTSGNNRIAVLNAVFLATTGNLAVIHNFTGSADGATPLAGLTMDQGGNLYGTTYAGGAGYGAAYKLAHKGSGWIFNPLYSFAGGNDGAGPFARVDFGPDGVLYGTTRSGGGYTGCNRYDYDGCGTLFSLKPPIRVCKSTLCPWTETQLYAFTGGSDGAHPAQGDLNFDQAGNIYSATYQGGSGSPGCGVVFKLTRSGNSWMETVLYSFSNTGDGCFAHAVTLQAGNLYGTAITGGAHSLGTVFELAPSGPPWTESTLYSFLGGTEGQEPVAGVIFDSSGNMYGSTIHQGQGGGGTVFELTPSGGGWTFGTLYGFPGSTGPEATLIMDAAGNLYGTTVQDGFYGYGSVFKLTPSSSGSWSYVSLHDFTGGSDGAYPYSNIVFDTQGKLYGTASLGGTGQACTGGCGVVFEITP